MLKEWLTHLRHLGHKALVVGLVVLLLLLAMGAGLWFLLRPQEGATVSSSPEVVYLATTEGVVVALRTSDGSLLWKESITGLVPGEQPVIANGVVYISTLESVIARNAQDGRLLWQFQTVESLTIPPVVVNGMVYFVDYIPGRVGQPPSDILDALDARDGRLLWRFQTTQEWASSPVVVDGVVYLSARSATYAFGARDGHQLWSSSVGSSGEAPTVVNGVVYLFSTVTSVAALDARDGHLLWEDSTTDWLPGEQPAVANGVVYISTLESVIARNAQDGRLLWSVPDQAFFQPVVVKGVVCFSTESTVEGSGDQGTVYGIDARSGGQVWRFQPGGQAEYYVLSFPQEEDGVVFITSPGGSRPGDPFLYALRASDGHQLWRFQVLHRGGLAPSLVAKGVVYVAGGRLIVALRVRDGEQLWQVQM
jgi:outer membrane protein assembly factor BamB